MIIVNKKTLQIVNEKEFRQLHPNISFPAVLSSAALQGTDYEYVTPQAAPSTNKYQSFVLGLPYKESGLIKINYEVIDNIPPVEVIIKEYELAIDNLLKDKASEYKYDSVYTMISYRGDPNSKFANEAESMFQWRSAVWTKANEILSNFINSSYEDLPSIESVLEQLPEFNLLS